MRLHGRIHGMRTTIDGAGRIVVPKPIRDRLHLQGGASLEIAERDGVIELRPAPVEIEIVETPHGPVARALGDVAPLDDATVRDTLDQVRR
jgi:AbrB family looped-hinge helix DNA binding protein